MIFYIPENSGIDSAWYSKAYIEAELDNIFHTIINERLARSFQENSGSDIEKIRFQIGTVPFKWRLR